MERGLCFRHIGQYKAVALPAMPPATSLPPYLPPPPTLSADHQEYKKKDESSQSIALCSVGE